MKRGRKKKREKYRLAELWYGIRRLAGLQAVSEYRLLRVRRLDPGCNAPEEIRKEDNDRLKLALYCITAGVMLMLVSVLSFRSGDYTAVKRPDYGEEEEYRVLKAEYKGKEYEIPVTVGSRQYTENEWEMLKQEAYRNVTAAALGENPDWLHISGALDLSEEQRKKILWDNGAKLLNI